MVQNYRPNILQQVQPNGPKLPSPAVNKDDTLGCSDRSLPPPSVNTTASRWLGWPVKTLELFEDTLTAEPGLFRTRWKLCPFKMKTIMIARSSNLRFHTTAQIRLGADTAFKSDYFLHIAGPTWSAILWFYTISSRPISKSHFWKCDFLPNY